MRDIETRLDITLHEVRAHVSEWLIDHTKEMEKAIKASLAEEVGKVDLHEVVTSQVRNQLGYVLSSAVRESIESPLREFREKLTAALRPESERLLKEMLTTLKNP